MLKLEPKRANEERLYRHDWSAFLGDATILSQVTTAQGATISTSALDGTQAVRFKVTGGTNGTPALITQTITSSAGDVETEVFTLEVAEYEAVSLAEAKDYLGVRHSEKDAVIARMIPAARLWVEDHCSLTIARRQFTHYALPDPYGGINLPRGPLISLDGIDYTDSAGAPQTYTARAFPPQGRIIAHQANGWPSPRHGEELLITYTAGYAPAEVDDRLAAAMLALIEGEFSEGYAYPQRAIDAAERCLVNLRPVMV